MKITNKSEQMEGRLDNKSDENARASIVSSSALSNTHISRHTRTCFLFLYHLICCVCDRATVHCSLWCVIVYGLCVCLTLAIVIIGNSISSSIDVIVGCCRYRFHRRRRRCRCYYRCRLDFGIIVFHTREHQQFEKSHQQRSTCCTMAGNPLTYIYQHTHIAQYPFAALKHAHSNGSCIAYRRGKKPTAAMAKHNNTFTSR